MLEQIFVPSAVFSMVVVLLAALVLTVRRRLEPSGPVKLMLNGRKSLVVEAGRRLLWALADQGIYLPAACGGRGTCGQCRVLVESGTRPALPTEMAHFSEAEAEMGYRLACMLRIRDDMRLALPEDVLSAERRLCRVASTRSIATFVRELVLAPVDGRPVEFEAGDYVLLEAPAHQIEFRDFDIPSPYHDEWESLGLKDLESRTREPVTRAYSLANPPEEADHAVLVVRIALPPPTAPHGTPPGAMSSYLFSLRPGDEIALSGPFGDFHATDSARDMVLIAGGVGVAPIRSIVLDQLSRNTGRKMIFWHGARNEREVFYRDEFEQASREHDNFDYQVALSGPGVDAGWTGHRGFVHTVLYEEFLTKRPAPQECEYYLCGPPLMASAVLAMLGQFEVDSGRIFFDDFGS